MYRKLRKNKIILFPWYSTLLAYNFSMFFLSSIVIAIPLFFSHILAPFGITFIEGSSFERVKVFLFLILLWFALIEFLSLRFDLLKKLSKTTCVFSGIFLVLPLIIHLFSSNTWWSDFFWGSQEKHHGYLFYAGLVVFFLLLSFTSTWEKYRFLRYSLYTSLVVALFALLEYFGIFSFFPSANMSITWGTGRTNSTLGNPNYLAGYFLMHLPLISLIRTPERYIALGILALALFTTKSFIGISFAVLLFLYWVSRNIPYQKIVFPIVLLISWIIFFSIVPEEKFLSLMSRFVLIRETLIQVFSHIPTLLFGHGPDTIIALYNTERSDLLNQYFPVTSAIDSSHNIFIDFLYSYWLILTATLLLLIVRKWISLPYFAQVSIVSMLAFFSLNVIILVPLIPLLILFSLYAPDPKRPKHSHD